MMVAFDEEPKWSRFEGFDAFAGQNAAVLKTRDVEACKVGNRQT